MGTRAPVDEEDAGKLLLGPGASRAPQHAQQLLLRRGRRCADFKTYPEPRKSAKGMMLAEVKLLMEDKISGDKEKGEETPTTKTKCVPSRRSGDSCQPVRAATRWSGSGVTTQPDARNVFASRFLTRCPVPALCGSVFQKTYEYVTRFSYPGATVETAQSIRECAPQP